MPRVSVIVPTYERRDLAVQAIASLARQVFDKSFEVIVVVDGSSDGTADALRQMTFPAPLRIIEQSNQGAGRARNRGAAEATGEILLFLDDDMTADVRLLAEHDRSHCEGADVVLGHMPLHPDSPPGFLSIEVEQWAEERLHRLEQADVAPDLHDLLTGQLSVSRAAFDQVGGFDLQFTHGGSFGNEDVDLGYRLLQAGSRCVFNADAISWQRYEVPPTEILRRIRDVGRADVAFARKHPEQCTQLFNLNRGGRVARWVLRPLAAMGPAGALALDLTRGLGAILAEHLPDEQISQRAFGYASSAQYWRGVYESGGIPNRSELRILAYHAIADREGAPVIASYCVPPQIFSRQIELLERLGFRFVTPDEVVRALDGCGGLPRRAVLLTFDDCYEDLLHTALPILERHQIRAAAFAVSGYIGGGNVWDQAIGAPLLPLLDAGGLRELERRGVEIGAHSRSHPELPLLPIGVLYEEIAGSVADLEAHGLVRPRLFAYPYGEFDERVAGATANSGLRAAFTVQPGRVGRHVERYRVPRIEILRGDSGARFALKVLFPCVLRPLERVAVGVQSVRRMLKLQSVI